MPKWTLKRVDLDHGTPFQRTFTDSFILFKFFPKNTFQKFIFTSGKFHPPKTKQQKGRIK